MEINNSSSDSLLYREIWWKKRGFGFVTIGANVDEFHAAANQTKQISLKY